MNQLLCEEYFGVTSALVIYNLNLEHGPFLLCFSVMGRQPFPKHTVVGLDPPDSHVPFSPQRFSCLGVLCIFALS